MTWPKRARQQRCPRAAPTAETPQFSALSRPSFTCRCPTTGNEPSPRTRAETSRFSALSGPAQAPVVTRTTGVSITSKNCTNGNCGTSTVFGTVQPQATVAVLQRAREQPDQELRCGISGFCTVCTVRTRNCSTTGICCTLSRTESEAPPRPQKYCRNTSCVITGTSTTGERCAPRTAQLQCGYMSLKHNRNVQHFVDERKQKSNTKKCWNLSLHGHRKRKPPAQFLKTALGWRCRSSQEEEEGGQA